MAVISSCHGHFWTLPRSCYYFPLEFLKTRKTCNVCNVSNYACGFIFNNLYLKSLTNYFKIKHVKLAMYLILHVVISLIIFILSVSQITYVLAVEPEKLLSKLDVRIK